MSKHISRRLFLSGAALLGAGIALDRVGRGEQVITAELGIDGELTPTTAYMKMQEATPTVIPPTFTPSVPKMEIIAVAAGFFSSLVVTRSGEVIMWGLISSVKNIPVGLQDVVKIASGFSHVLALTKNGEVVAWGDNGYGQTDVPAGLSEVIQVAAGDSHSLALTKSGEVVAWGTGQVDIPAGLSDVVHIAVVGSAISKHDRYQISFSDTEREYSFALTKRGDVVVWGERK